MAGASKVPAPRGQKKRPRADESPERNSRSAQKESLPNPKRRVRCRSTTKSEGDDAVVSSTTAVDKNATNAMKRKLDGLLDALASANPRKRPGENTPLAVYHKVGRQLQHDLGPNIASMWLLRFGPTAADMEAGRNGANADVVTEVTQWSERKRKVTLESHGLLMKKVPGLVDLLDILEGNVGSLNVLTAYLDACAKGARGDEVGSLRNRLGDLLPELQAKELHGRMHKAQRGFMSTETGRLLCPQSRLAEYDVDPEGFCKKVLNGQVQIRAMSFPSFLYDQKLVVAGRLEPGLLRSGFLVNCYKCVYTGPTSAMSETGRKTAGKPSRAQHMKLSSVSARSIAHVATMARFVLNDQPEWSRTDGSFDGQEFFECLVHIFTNKKWARETLTWWDKQVFGAMANRSVTEHGRDEDEAAMDTLMAELGADESDTDGEAQG